MISGAAAKPVMARQRSRAGCYTCRIRKVRCKIDPRGVQASGQPHDCDDCQRLGLECRWHAPEPGEQYVPPPKRRRTVGQRYGRQSDNNNEDSPASSNQPSAGEPKAYRADTPACSLESSSPGLSLPSDQANSVFSQSTNLQLDLFSDLGFDFDLSQGSGPLDLILAGEGLDFIPLPAVDPSTLQWSSDSTSPTVPTRVPPADQRQGSMRPHLAVQTEEDITSGATNLSSPSVSEDNRRLIQHYLQVMKGFAKVDDRSKDANNLFISAFSESLYFPPLFYAILAFSASHLSIEDTSYVDQANTYDRLAQESFEAFKQDHSTQAEGLLSALFVRVKKVHVTAGSVASFLDLMAAAAEIVSTKQGERALEDPSTLARRIILRLAILDARATHYRLGGGALVNSLRRLPALSFIFSDETHSAISPGDLISLLRADIFRMRVAELDMRLHKQMESEFIVPSPIRMDDVKLLYMDVQREIHQWESRMISLGEEPDHITFVDEEVLDSATYGHYTVLSALHSALLYLHIIHPLLSFDREVSVSRILYCQLKVCRDPSRTDSPSSILPSSLFLAGLCTSDPIRRDWVIKLFKEGERWGLYVRKARELLEALVKLQAKGITVDVCSAMDQFTGRFII
ncbi:hypothetical protein TOPH_05022 [Tolypocladium ophioglossoides CBS 100239]|uniref:Zn(2)-C6 fungal-type domain-containing protein n=1 Tax=Tolypocladium ophioglossoides (strain CBS 100239) TaxID=1163406 RepID=A0A0L0N8R5_TOLOC|nr:hypothetical protein TOPH_05022 [Tolypocladium ophioglossoides CBS 100239]